VEVKRPLETNLCETGQGSIGSPQNLEDRFAPDCLCSSGLSLSAGSLKLRAEIVGIHVPKRVNDDLDNISTAAGRNTGQSEELPLWLGCEVCGSCRGHQVLPVRDREIDGRARVKREARQVQSKPPI